VRRHGQPYRAVELDGASAKKVAMRIVMKTRLKQAVMLEIAPPKVRAVRVWRMHAIDLGHNPCVGPSYMALYKCNFCGTRSEWKTASTYTEIRRGIPCPKCNNLKAS